MISVYIDNFLLALNNPNALFWLKDIIKKEYNIKNLGDV